MRVQFIGSQLHVMRHERSVEVSGPVGVPQARDNLLATH